METNHVSPTPPSARSPAAWHAQSQLPNRGWNPSMPPAVDLWSPNHWIAREVSIMPIF